MTEAKLMVVELSPEEDARMKALIAEGKQDEVETFLLRKVYTGDAFEVNEPRPTKAAQAIALRVLRQEVREQVMRDVFDAIHYLLHQAEVDRATTLSCATAAMLDGESTDMDAVHHVLKEVAAVRSAKEKATCRGTA